MSAEEYCCRCAKRLVSEEAVVRAIIEDTFSVSGERLNQELANYIGALRPRFRIAALTNHWAYGRALIEKRGITRLFDLIVLSAEEGANKPNPEIYRILLEQLRMAPEELCSLTMTRRMSQRPLRLACAAFQFRSTERTACRSINRLTEGSSICKTHHMKPLTCPGTSTLEFRLYKEFFRALGNATRFRIVQLLREGPCHVGEIAECLKLEQSRVSHSLACLLNCGFVVWNW